MRPIKGYEKRYSITSCGRVWSNRRKRFLSPAGADGDYQMIGLWDGKKQKHYLIHRLVAEAYLPNPDNLPEVNHKDEVRSHNWVSNLEWCTHDYNMSYGNRKENWRKSMLAWLEE